MKYLIVLCVFSLLCACSQSLEKDTLEISTDLTASNPKQEEIPADVFYLCYSWAGLGSNMGTLAPMFVVKGTHFTYTMEQNSYYSEKTIAPEKVCEGEISEATSNKIIDLVKDIEDSVVYNTNIGIMSGGITSIFIKHQDTKVEFRLHNASDPIAKKIVDLLNSHIPEKYRQLTIWADR